MIGSLKQDMAEFKEDVTGQIEGLKGGFTSLQEELERKLPEPVS